MSEHIGTVSDISRYGSPLLTGYDTPVLLWTVVVSDALIMLASLSIALALLFAVGNRLHDRFRRGVLILGLFIFTCGITFFVHSLSFWYPNDGLQAATKAVVALISAITAVVLWPMASLARTWVEDRQKEAEDLSVTNSRLRRTLNGMEQERRDLERLNKLSGILHVCSHFEEIGRAATDTLRNLFPHSSGALYLSESIDAEFSLLSCWGDYEPKPGIVRWQCWAFRLGHVFPDDKVITSFSCEAGNCGMDSGRFCLPVTGAGKILALLQIQGIHYYSDPRDQSILSIITERLGLALYNLRLKNSLEFNSTRDELTGLFNRRYLDENLQTEWVRASRDGSRFSVVMFDLDNFKQLNDQWGHEAGDQALRLFARVLQSSLRGGDVACRYGGEEFVLILPGSSVDNAEDTANRVRLSLAGSVRKSPSPAFERLTVSAGVASFPDSGMTGTDVLQRADRALYTAKNSGRNRVVRATLP